MHSLENTRAHRVGRYSVLCCAQQFTLHSSVECTTRFRAELHWCIARGYDCYGPKNYLVASTNRLKHTHMHTDTRRYCEDTFMLRVQIVILRTCISRVKWSPKSNSRSAVIPDECTSSSTTSESSVYARTAQQFFTKFSITGPTDETPVTTHEPKQLVGYRNGLGTQLVQSTTLWMFAT